jgi:nitrogen fixation protein FixH
MRWFFFLLCISALILTGCKSTAPNPATKLERQALRLAVTTAPPQPRMDKPFTVRVQLLDSEGGPVTSAKISGALAMKSMDHGATGFEFTEKGQGVYEGISKVEMSGEWELKLIAEHGAERIEQDFPVTVGD